MDWSHLGDAFSSLLHRDGSLSSIHRSAESRCHVPSGQEAAQPVGSGVSC